MSNSVDYYQRIYGKYEDVPLSQEATTDPLHFLQMLNPSDLPGGVSAKRRVFAGIVQNVGSHDNPIDSRVMREWLKNLRPQFPGVGLPGSAYRQTEAMNSAMRWLLSQPGYYGKFTENGQAFHNVYYKPF